MKHMVNEQIALIRGKKHQLEALLLKTYGQKFDLMDTFNDHEVRVGSKQMIPFEQESVITGNQLGILGAAIYNVNLLIHLYYVEATNIWTGGIDLRWYHPDGGQNGHTIGWVMYKYNDDQTYGEFSITR